MSENHEVLFTPFVTIEVDSTGKVVDVSVDWSDTLQNVYTVDGDEVWIQHGGPAPESAEVACTYLDDKAVRDRVLAALRPEVTTTA